MLRTFKQLLEYGKKRRANLSKALAFSLIHSTIGISQIIAIIITIQVLLGSIDYQTALIKVAICTIVCIVGSFLAAYQEQINALQAGMYTSADIRVDIAKQLRKMPLAFFKKAKTERIISTLTSTLQGLETASTMSLIMIVSGLFNSCAMFIFMCFYEWRIAIIVLIGIILYLLVVAWQMAESRKSAPARQEAQTNLSSRALSFLQGIRVIKAYSFKNSDAELQKAIADSSKENIALTNKSMPSQFSANLVVAIFESLILIVTLYLFINLKSIDLEKTIILIIFSFFAFASLNQAGSVLSMIGMIESSIAEVEEIKNAKTLNLKEAEVEVKNDEIVLDNVSFAYGKREILHNISTTFKENSLTAIIGPSGSGKTTLCRLIARFQDVNSGKIMIGGVDVKDMPYETLMDKISIVFQNVYLFEDTILNNIRFGKPDASLEEVRAAAKDARCDDFIMSLPEAYDTLIHEGGNSLSGGEKQRISIARCILKDSPIIILDEATSALDANNEKAFFEAIDELTKNKTVIMIAHRIATLKYADKIIALQNGCIVEEGKPNELIHEDGLYSRFLKSREAAKGWYLNS